MFDEPVLLPGRILSAEEAQDLPVWRIEPFPGGIEAARAAAKETEAERESKRLADIEKAAAARVAAMTPPAPPAVDPAERERIRREAFDEGFAAGYDEGMKAADVEVKRIKSIADNAGSAFMAFEESIAPALLELALTVARQVVRREIATQPDAVLAVMHEAFDQMIGGETGKQLFVNPIDVDMVRAHLSEDLASGPWKIVEDPRVEAGGCRVATRQSDIDATVSTRWKRTVALLGGEVPWTESAPPALPATAQAKAPAVQAQPSAAPTPPAAAAPSAPEAARSPEEMASLLDQAIAPATPADPSGAPQ